MMVWLPGEHGTGKHQARGQGDAGCVTPLSRCVVVVCTFLCSLLQKPEAILANADNVFRARQEKLNKMKVEKKEQVSLEPCRVFPIPSLHSEICC